VDDDQAEQITFHREAAAVVRVIRILNHPLNVCFAWQFESGVHDE
jgi:hypothetical protein